MRKFIGCLIIIGAFIITKVNAQFEYGVQGGFNLNKLSYASNNKVNPRSGSMTTGFNVDFVAKYNIQKNLFLQSGLGYTFKGGEYKFDCPNSSEWFITNKMSLNYLILPINIGYTYKDFEVLAGPNISYCLGGKDKSTISTTGSTETYTIKPESNKYTNTLNYNTQYPISATDIGLNIGVVYNFHFVNFNPVKVGIGYDMGLTNLNVLTQQAANGGGSRSDTKMKNRTFSLNVTYMFGGLKNN